jgi:ribosome-associated translation inhibitor RaiA
MSNGANSSSQILEDRLRIGTGFAAEDRARVVEMLAPLARHLAHWAPEQVDLEISVKNRGGPEQKVTLEAQLPRWPLVVTADDPDLDHALAEVRKELIRQIEDKKSKRDPRTTRTKPVG